MPEGESFDQWLGEATPDRREVGVCLDRTLVGKLAQAEEELLELRRSSPGVAMLEASEEEAGLQAKIDQLRAEVKAKTRTLVFEGLGWGAWRALLAEHPPAADQDDVFRKAVQRGFLPHALVNIGFNAETFAPAAIAASCQELTIHQAETLMRKAPAGVIDRLWAAVLEVNTGGGADPFSGGGTAAGSAGAPATAKR